MSETQRTKGTIKVQCSLKTRTQELWLTRAFEFSITVWENKTWRCVNRVVEDKSWTTATHWPQFTCYRKARTVSPEWSVEGTRALRSQRKETTKRTTKNKGDSQLDCSCILLLSDKFNKLSQKAKWNKKKDYAKSVMDWSPIQGVFLMPSVPGGGSRSDAALNRIKWIVEMNECVIMYSFEVVTKEYTFIFDIKGTNKLPYTLKFINCMEYLFNCK